jgi:RNA recognition motif-containing protein
MNIYVGNISYSTTEQDLEQTFGEFGEVTDARVIRYADSGRSKGFAFVTMENDAEAQAAIDALNEKELQGRNIRVNEARPREERPERRY